MDNFVVTKPRQVLAYRTVYVKRSFYGKVIKEIMSLIGKSTNCSSPEFKNTWSIFPYLFPFMLLADKSMSLRFNSPPILFVF